MTDTTFTFDAEGAGPFQEPINLEFPSGLTVWVAPNNWGKSWSLRQMARFGSDSLRVGDLRPNRDDVTGTVAKVRVTGFGLSCEMQAREGEAPELDGTPPPIEGLPDPIGVLVTGAHRKGEGAAFRARLEALCQWIGVESTEDDIRAILGEDAEISGLYGRAIGKKGEVVFGKPKSGDLSLVPGPNLISVADAVREAVLYMARMEKQRLETAQADVGDITGERRAIVDASGVSDRVLLKTDPDVDRVRDELQGLRQQLARLETRRESGVEENARRAAALESLGDRPDPSATKKEAAEADLAAKVAEEDRRESERKVADLEKQLAVERERLQQLAESASKAKARANKSALRATEADSEAKRYDETKSSLSEEIEIPSAEDVEKAAKAVEQAEKDLATHYAADKYRGVTVRLDAAKSAAEKHETRHKELSSEAKLTWSRLAAVVNQQLSGERIRVGEDETVEIEIDGEWFDIADQDEVGEGVRFDACYELLLSKRSQRVIVVEGSTAVDTAHLQRLGELARERGVVLIFERQPVDGEDPNVTKLVMYGLENEPVVVPIEYEMRAG